MKRRNIFYATVVALSVVCMGWSPPAAADKAATAKKAPAPKPKKTSDWNGQFFTEYQGEVGELNMLALGRFLGGTFVSNGEQYSIGGRIDGGRATGSVTGPDYQSFPFEALADPAGIAFTVTVRNENGVPTPVTLTFERPEAFAARRAAAEAKAAKAGGSGAGAGASGGARAAGDPRMVGAWRATEAGRSGDFTWASDNFIRFAADGSCADGGGRTYAGSGSVSGGSDAGSITACQWSVRDRVLYMRSGGGGWQQVAKYAVHENGNIMMWTYGDGSKRIWERQ